MVVVVGDHATYHKKYDAPLESDIDALAGTVSGWVRRSVDSAAVGPDAAEAIAASRSGSQISTLILPADASWSEGGRAGRGTATAADARRRADRRPTSLAVLRSGEPTVILIGGDATRGPGLAAAARIAAGDRRPLVCETFPTRLERGAGVPAVDRLAYFAEAVAAQLDGAKHLVLAGAKSPVSFFAYPSMPSDLVPAGCEVHVLAEYGGAADALAALADELAPGTTLPRWRPLSRPQLPTGALTSASAADVIGALLPERAIVVDESNTSGLPLQQATAGRTGPRLADADRRGDRLRHPDRGGRRGGRPRPAGALPGIRRVGDVHDFGLVDPGARKPQRDHGRLRQQRLRHPADRAAARRGRVGARPQGAEPP